MADQEPRVSYGEGGAGSLITTPQEFYAASFDYGRGRDVTQHGVGHYTEVHVSNGEVIVAPAPVDNARHNASALHGSHSLFEVLAEEPGRFSDIAPILTYAQDHHLGWRTHMGRAGLVSVGDETVLRLYHLNGHAYEDHGGQLRTGHGWLDGLLSLVPTLGIDRVEHVTGTGTDRETARLGFDGTRISAHLSSHHVRIPDELKPKEWIPTGTAAGLVVGASLESVWEPGLSDPDWRAAHPHSKSPLQRTIRSSLTVADASDARHEALSRVLKEQGVKESPSESVELYWQEHLLGVNGNFNTDTRLGRDEAAVNLMLTSTESIETLAPVIAAFGESLVQAALTRLTLRRTSETVDGQVRDRPMDCSQSSLNFLVSVTNPYGGMPQVMRREGTMGDVIYDRSSSYQMVGQDQFMKFLFGEPTA